MFKEVFDAIGLSGIISKATISLYESYGENEYCSITQIQDVLKKLKLQKHIDTPYVYASHCKPEEFYSKFDHLKYDYFNVRDVVAKKCFGSRVAFTQSLLKQHANKEFIKINASFVKTSGGYSHNSTSSISHSDGSGGSGGCDGGGGC